MIKKSKKISETNTLHNVRQRNIVYAKALRNVCSNIAYLNTLHNVRQRNIVIRANVLTLALLHKGEI